MAFSARFWETAKQHQERMQVELIAEMVDFIMQIDGQRHLSQGLRKEVLGRQLLRILRNEP